MQNVVLYRCTVQAVHEPSRFRAQQVGATGASSRLVALIVTWSRKNEPFVREGEEGLRPQAPVKPQRNRKAMSYDAGTPPPFPRVSQRR